MGARANIRFRFDDENSIYLYGHWDGPRLAENLAEHLATEVARGRWNDESYLCRVLVHRILNDMGDPDSATGHGLAPYEVDNEYPITIVDLPTQQVMIGDSVWSYQAFAALSPAEIRKLVDP